MNNWLVMSYKKPIAHGPVQFVWPPRKQIQVKVKVTLNFVLTLEN
jgi:hypothetical protein